jgi:hypothetical protein
MKNKLKTKERKNWENKNDKAERMKNKTKLGRTEKWETEKRR